jgi:hypothetical protein
MYRVLALEQTTVDASRNGCGGGMAFGWHSGHDPLFVFLPPPWIAFLYSGLWFLERRWKAEERAASFDRLMAGKGRS